MLSIRLALHHEFYKLGPPASVHECCSVDPTIFYTYHKYRSRKLLGILQHNAGEYFSGEHVIIDDNRHIKMITLGGFLGI